MSILIDCCFSDSDTHSGPRLVLTAGKEVVLSAGPIGTPHILLHSGIGDSVALNALGINSTLNLPAVGKNLHDHTSVSPTWSTTSTDTTGFVNAALLI